MATEEVTAAAADTSAVSAVSATSAASARSTPSRRSTSLSFSSPPAPICVAIIGYSGAARTFHIPLILSLPDLFQLHTIQQRPSSSGPPANKDHPNVHVAPTVEAVFEGQDGNKAGALPPRSLVIITTSNETHTPFALQALRAGHHVVVEKPAALTVEEAESLKQESEARGLVCAAFQNRRLDSDFLTLRTLLGPTRHTKPSLPSPIGQPTLVESRFDRYRPFAKFGWREEITPDKGGGLLWDLGSHLIDQALFLFGPPEKVTAFVSSNRGQLSAEVDDDFLVHLHYPTAAPLPPDSEAPAPGTRIAGPRVTLGASCLSAHISTEQPRWRVEGTRGSFEKRGLDPQEDQLKAGWTPATHPNVFGSYLDRIPASLRLGRLTTTMARNDGQQAQASPVSAGGEAGAAAPTSAAAAAPAQPKLVSSSIPMLPGRYIQFYQNVGQTIRDVEQARAAEEPEGEEEQGDDGEDKSNLNSVNLKATASVRKALENLFVKPDQVIMTTKCILLARQSAAEGRTLAWNP